LVAIEHDRLLGTDRALPAPLRPRPAGAFYARWQVCY
jgi:hypothetical protein